MFLPGSLLTSLFLQCSSRLGRAGRVCVIRQVRSGVELGRVPVAFYPAGHTVELPCAASEASGWDVVSCKTSNLALACSNLACCKPGPDFSCGGCKVACYCDRECQRAAWKDGNHKACCKLLGR